MTSANEPWTVMRLLDWTTGHFRSRDLESPRLCAEMLLAGALGCSRMDLYTRFAHQPTDAQRAAFRQWVQRAADGEPVAYLVGVKEFYSLPIRVTPAVLIPRPETEMLVDQAVLYARQHPGPLRVWDVCTGSGCIAAAVAGQLPESRILATDISDDALAVAQGNAEALGFADRITAARADLLAVPAAWEEEWSFDILLSNPPYVGERDELGPGVEHEPALALRAGADGLDVLRPLIAAAGGAVKPGGLMALEFGMGQADAVRDLIVAADDFAEPQILRDHQGIERIAAAIRK